jgi:hypothetical protein
VPAGSFKKKFQQTEIPRLEDGFEAKTQEISRTDRGAAPWPEKWKKRTSPGWDAATFSFRRFLMFLRTRG